MGNFWSNKGTLKTPQGEGYQFSWLPWYLRHTHLLCR